MTGLQLSKIFITLPEAKLIFVLAAKTRFCIKIIHNGHFNVFLVSVAGFLSYFSLFIILENMVIILEA